MCKMKKLISLSLIVLLVMSFLNLSGCRKETSKPLNVIVVFHNHQPFYKDPTSLTYILPWVRLHAAKDYYRMPYIVSQYPEVKISFDLSGSLIDQLFDYMNGAEDTRQILSEKSPSELSYDEKMEILAIPGGFFDINWDHILKKIPMYEKILNKRQEIFSEYSLLLDKDAIVKSFSDQEYLNLQTLFNIFWLDIEYVQSNEKLSKLYDKAINEENFTEDDKNIVLEEQKKILNMVFEEYKSLADSGKIEVFTTPYSHPISPIIADFGWNEDLNLQIDMANDVFSKAFGFKPKGVWASECAINDSVLKAFSEKGWNFTISDADNLYQLGIDTKNSPLSKYVPYYIDGVTVFFRDKYLSDGISFRYSGKSVEESIKDIEVTLLNLQKENKTGEFVYTIALDGENAWEYYENDGNDFLNGFYKELSELQKQGKIKTITPSEYIRNFGKGKEVAEHNISTLNLQGEDISKVKSYSELPIRESIGYFGESSWVNPTLDTWIGEPQENTAWLWLSEAREKLITSSGISPEDRNLAYEMLMRAEGSDWFWWYGSDQDSGNDPSFDRLFKLYLSGIYKALNIQIPQYLYGNYFPDGTPYKSVEIQFKEGKPVSIPFIKGGITCEGVYKEGNIKFVFKNAPSYVSIGVFNGRTLNTFFSEQTLPKDFNLLPYPYEGSSVGIPIDFELTLKNFSKSNCSVTVNTDELDKSNLYMAFATFSYGELIPLSLPLQVRLPVKIEGKLIGEILDEEGDDFGPGTYVYPLNDVFKNAGKGLFDIVSMRVYDGNDSYIFEFQMENIGGNPWNGPNGISFQIIETYIDFKDGGSTSAIEPKGSRIEVDHSHPWDIAFRIAGWSYGNFIMISDGKTYQGELTIRVESSKNTIYALVPKKYMLFSNGYKPYIAVISGSQDGYSTGYFRTVSSTASEWMGGGASKEAFDKNISPNVYDIFVGEGQSQKEVLSSFDSDKEILASVPMLPLTVPKPSPKVTGKIELQMPEKTSPGKEFSAVVTLSNIGKGDQADNASDEFRVDFPEYITFVELSASSGKALRNVSGLSWNGAIKSGEGITISMKFKLNSDVPNAFVLKFVGKILYDGKGDGINNVQSNIEGSATVRYPVNLKILFDSPDFERNGVNVSFMGAKSYFVTEFGDLYAPIEPLMKALGASYSFDNVNGKLTIMFLESKYEHWIGQNKALLNGTAIPLVPKHPEIRSFAQDNLPIVPLSAIAYALKLKYTVDSVNKIAYLEYIP